MYGHGFCAHAEKPPPCHAAAEPLPQMRAFLRWLLIRGKRYCVMRRYGRVVSKWRDWNGIDIDRVGREACPPYFTMHPPIIIRPETNADVDAINKVTVSAFKTLDISNHTEQFIIGALRTAGFLTVSLVAEVDGRVAGHIAISPVAISDGTGNWYGLGPLSVLPEYQRQGIGKALVKEGLARLKDLNARGVCLAGHPDYYTKFGFRNVPGLVHEGVPPEFFFALSFDGHIPHGTVTFHEAFKADGQSGSVE